MENKSQNGKIKENKNLQDKNVDRQNNKTAWLVVGIVSLALLIGAGFYIYSYNNQQTEITSLQEDNEILNDNLAMRDSLVNEWVNTLVKIEEDLVDLQGKEKSLIQKSSDPELTPSLRESILHEIQEVNALLEKNKQKIATLNQKLRNSGVQIASLQKKVNSLEQSIAHRDSSIDVLKSSLADRDFMVSELNTVVDSLNTSLDEKESTLVAQTEILDKQHQELNTAWVATGNPKELEEKGVVVREGGFLGLGKSKTLSSEIPEDYFREVKISETRMIAVDGSEIALISEHPSESYKVVNGDSLVSYIEITNPDEFWKITRYAVVEARKQK